MPATNDVIHTAVSRPGPVEARVLASLADAFAVRPRVGAGVALRTVESRRAPVEGQPTVVLLHGRGHAATIWARWLRALEARGRVVAIDLPGFGHSGAGKVGAGAEPGLDFFVAPVEAIARTEGPIVLVGHSLGALVALEIALRGRCDVRGLVLIGAMGLSPIILPGARAYLRFGPERLSRLAARVGRAAPRLGAGSAIDEELAALRTELSLSRGGRPAASRAFDAMVPLLGPVFHRRERLGELAVRTLLVWGSDDEAFPLPIAIDAATRIPRAKLEVLGRGHSPHLELPDRCIAAVRAFLDPD
jgi:pimeloyl-ACP methyl ester carboxylesterase